MKYQSRELLVTTKVAQAWHDSFDQKVDELMDIVGRIDTAEQVQRSVELLNVYHDTTTKNPRKLKRKLRQTEKERPFEFILFRN